MKMSWSILLFFLPGLFAVPFLSDIPTVVLEAVGLLAIQVEASHAFFGGCNRPVINS